MDQALANFGRTWQQATALTRYFAKIIRQAQEIQSQHAVKTGSRRCASDWYAFELSAHHTRGGTLVKKTKTSASYKLFALKNTTPPEPGLQYHSKGSEIEVEVWDIPFANFGQIVAEVPAPLGIGNVQLADGSWVKEFYLTKAMRLKMQLTSVISAAGVTHQNQNKFQIRVLNVIS